MFFASKKAVNTSTFSGINDKFWSTYPYDIWCPKLIMPFKGGISPTMVFKKVVLPIPFLPTKAVLVPRSNSMSETVN